MIRSNWGPVSAQTMHKPGLPLGRQTPSMHSAA